MRRLIRINIFDKMFELPTNTLSNEFNHIKNIVVRTLGRQERNFNLHDLLLKYVLFKKCNNCDKEAKYELTYDIKIENNIIYFNINGIKYNQYKNYEFLYCGTCLDKKLNANSLEFVSKVYGVDIKTANEIILNRNKSPFYRHNHKNDEEYKNFQRRDEKWYINKYGLEGTEKYKEHIKKWYEGSLKYNYKKDSMSLNFFINKNNGDLESAKIAYEKRKEEVKQNLNNFIKRWGIEEGTKKYKKHCELLAYLNTIESYIERYGEIDGPLKYKEWTNKISCNIENFIKKYGEIEGTLKYKKWLIGITNGNFYSKESKRFFDKLQEKLNINIKYGEKEYFIYDNEGFNNQHIFFYDGYIKKYNLIIEYDTPAYHSYIMNNNCVRLGNLEKDKFKENLVLKNNYNFYRVFVKNWKKETNTELEKLINYIKINYNDN